MILRTAVMTPPIAVSSVAVGASSHLPAMAPSPNGRSPRANPTRSSARAQRLPSAVMVAVAVLAFGFVGLVAMAPALRARRRRHAAVCAMCRRNHRRWFALALALASLTVVGGCLGLVGPPVSGCVVTLVGGNASVQGLYPDREPGIGPVLHRLLLAPTSGLAAVYARSQGYAMCDVRQPVIVHALGPRPGITSGCTVGSVYVKPRFDVGEDERLIRHEGRHSEQWAVLTAIGGIMLLPVAYMADESLHPKSLNHFEEAAGLAGGGYAPAPAPRPGPRAWAVAMWSVLALAVLRTRLRVLLRTFGWHPCPPEPQRCSRHTPSRRDDPPRAAERDESAERTRASALVG